MATKQKPPQTWPSCAKSPPQVVPLTILYGTQTFTAFEIATLLAQRAARRGFAPRVVAMDDFPRMELPDQKLVIFVASTTGDGEVPETMFNFWRFLLRRGLPAGVLGDVKFAVFGLGDSSYPKFNAVARRLDVRLRQLGAQPFVQIGLGDDQSEFGVYGDFDVWCNGRPASTESESDPDNASASASEPVQGLWNTLLQMHPFDTSKFEVDDSPLLREPVQFTTLSTSEGEGGESDDVKFAKCGFYHPAPTFYKTKDNTPVRATLLANTRITTSDWIQDVRHLEFSFDSTCTDGYQAGDIAVLYPRNGWWNSSLPSITTGPPTDTSEEANVEDPFIAAVCERLDLKPGMRFASDEVSWLPSRDSGGCSVRDLLVRCVAVICCSLWLSVPCFCTTGTVYSWSRGKFCSCCVGFGRISCFGVCFRAASLT